MRKRIKNYIKLRVKGKLQDLRIYYYGQKNIFEIDKNDGYKYHIAIFPHIIWDGNIADRHIAFDSYIDWLISTINYVKNRSDIKLYIKTHPAEITMFKSTPKTLDVLKQQINFTHIKNIVPNLILACFIFV